MPPFPPIRSLAAEWAIPRPISDVLVSPDTYPSAYVLTTPLLAFPRKEAPFDPAPLRQPIVVVG